MADVIKNYVKFLRGTSAAYAALETKDTDTLYFISETNQSNGQKVGKLYLGDILVAGNVTEDGTSVIDTLGELNDVDITGLEEGQFLKFDGSKWVPATIELADTYESNVFADIVPEEGQSHSEAITAIVGSTILQSGDIAVVKETIANDKYSYTAYIYDGLNWKAMDGNYNAENVYFDEDIIFTTEIGNVTLTNGQGTVAATGKNIKQVLEAIFTKESNPSATKPTVSVSLSGAKAVEAGATINPSYSISFNKGSYTYGPDTGITTTAYAVTDSKGRTSTTSSGTFESFIIAADETYNVKATASYTQGSVPVTNLGNEYSTVQIATGTTAQATSSSYTGYQQGYYIGQVNTATEITSNVIRGLSTKKGGNYKAGDVSYTVKKGAVSVIIAVPASKTGVTKVLNTTVNADMTSSFIETIMKVQNADLSDDTAVDYKVYVFTPAEAYGSDAALTITLG